MNFKSDSLKVTTANYKKGSFKKAKAAAAYQLGKIKNKYLDNFNLILECSGPEMAEAITGVTKSYSGDRDSMQADLVEKVASMKKPSVVHVVEDDAPKREPSPLSEPINLRYVFIYNN